MERMHEKAQEEHKSSSVIRHSTADCCSDAGANHNFSKRDEFQIRFHI
jgi:hypothetical protein